MDKQVNIWCSLKYELKRSLTLKKSNRTWQLPLAASLSCAIPLILFTSFGHLDYGLIASLGGLAYLYLPEEGCASSLKRVFNCSIGIILCYSIGSLSKVAPSLEFVILPILLISISIATKYYRILPPASLFFVLVATIGAYTQSDLTHIPFRILLVSSGCMCSLVIATIYVAYFRLSRCANMKAKPIILDFNFVLVDSLIIGTTVSLSLILARLLGFENPYWVAVSCITVIEGASLNAIKEKQIQRIAGTAFGIIITWFIFLFPHNKWSLIAIIFVSMYFIEALVVINYTLATIFITIMTITLAEASNFEEAGASHMINTRLIDTVLGSVTAFIGGSVLFNSRLRKRIKNKSSL